MSAYYLKQVVKDWSLGTIYKGMFQFMYLQCIAIAIVMFVRPSPLRSRASADRAVGGADRGSRRQHEPPGGRPAEGGQQQDEEEEEKQKK